MQKLELKRWFIRSFGIFFIGTALYKAYAILFLPGSPKSVLGFSYSVSGLSDPRFDFFFWIFIILILWTGIYLWLLEPIGRKITIGILLLLLLRSMLLLVFTTTTHFHPSISRFILEILIVISLIYFFMHKGTKKIFLKETHEN